MLAEQQYADERVECFHCGGTFARRELAAVEEIPGYRWPRYCTNCAAEIRAAHRRRCLLCGSAYYGQVPGDEDGICPSCCTPARLRELTRVRGHLARARALGLPATLTLAQWLATIEHFEGRCAYCGASPYRDLDHFIPLSAGGGTTSANCVPACSACNSAKRGYHPDTGLWQAAPADSIARVAAYLTRLSATLSA
jgi:5-methylcytosine-specific restriction endonuclease McrA